MPNDRTPPQTPKAEIPAVTGEVRPLRPDEVPRSFASSLIPIVDSIRQLNTQFGIRPYRVFIVHCVWTGTARGLGQPQEISRREILPTPNIGAMDSTTELMAATGLTENGGITVNQISAKYSEDDLMGRTPDIQDSPDIRTLRKNVEFYWEVVSDRTASPDKRRRYTPSAAPTLNKAGFSWSINLTRQEGARSRSNGSGRIPNDL